MVNNFNRLATYYDTLARLVFGKTLERASSYFVSSSINCGDSVLILGGGTGKILQSIPGSAEVTYVDMSQMMITKALKRRKHNTYFVANDFLSLDLSSFDVIICPFFLDVFDEEHLSRALTKIKSQLKPQGKLLIIDFTPAVLVRDRWLLGLMHIFFRIMVGLQSNRLKDIHAAVLDTGFEENEVAFFRRKTIFSRIYIHKETL